MYVLKVIPNSLVFTTIVASSLAQSAPITGRAIFESDFQSVDLVRNSPKVAGFKDAKTMDSTNARPKTQSALESHNAYDVWLIGAVPVDAYSFVRAALEVAPARYGLAAEATSLFRTNARP